MEKYVWDSPFNSQKITLIFLGYHRDIENDTSAFYLGHVDSWKIV